MKIAVKMQAILALALLGAGMVLAGCKSGPDLTKEQAQALIQAKYDAQPGAKFDIAVPDRGMQQAVTAGYVTGLKKYPNGYWADFKVTPAGAKAFTVLGGGDLIQWRPAQLVDPHYAVTVTSVAETHLKARDLGDITDLGANKTVTYSEDVNLSALPTDLQTIAHNPGNKLSTKRTATFALVNGAWAVQSII